MAIVRSLNSMPWASASDKVEISRSLILLMIIAGSSMPPELWHHMHSEICAAPMFVMWYVPIEQNFSRLDNDNIVLRRRW